MTKPLKSKIRFLDLRLEALTCEIPNKAMTLFVYYLN